MNIRVSNFFQPCCAIKKSPKEMERWGEFSHLQVFPCQVCKAVATTQCEYVRKAELLAAQPKTESVKKGESH